MKWGLLGVFLGGVLGFLWRLVSVLGGVFWFLGGVLVVFCYFLFSFFSI